MGVALDAPSSQAEERYFCTGEKAVGFRLDGGDWKNSTFNTDGDRYVIERMPPRVELGGETFTWSVKRMGTRFNSFDCEDMGETRILCGGLGAGFVFNPMTLRYLEFYGIGYVDGDEPGNTPNITLGTCVLLEQTK